MGGPGQRSDPSEDLRWEVCQIQRRSSEWQTYWDSYCDVLGGGVRDPRRHAASFLKNFIQVCANSGEATQPDPRYIIGAAPPERESRGERPRARSWTRQGGHDSWDRDRDDGHSGERIGVLEKDKGSYGFIRQDGTDESMFVMPASCHGFGGVLPAVGTRVAYTVTTDQKTGRIRAEDVRPAGKSQEVRWPYTEGWTLPPPAPESPNRVKYRGVMEKEKGTFGFIRQDRTDDHLFVMPSQCEGFNGNLPPMGQRVVYVIGSDPKTGKPRAEEVWPESNSYQDSEQFYQWSRYHEPREQPEQWVHLEPEQPPLGEERTGTMESDKGNYGFIKQDAFEDTMFVLPPFPPMGARVAYRVVLDQKTGRVRADDVRVIGKSHQASSRRQSEPTTERRSAVPQRRAPAPPLAVMPPAPPMPKKAEGEFSGTMDKDGSSASRKEKGTFGFIKQDDDGEHLFVMPSHCPAFGGVLPDIGTRVIYRLGADPKTGRPRAEEVRPESEDADGPVRTPRTMDVDRGKHGFIKQETLASLHSGEEFVEVVKSVQRRNSAWLDFWHRWCDSFGGGLYDPRRHDPLFLRRFLEMVQQEEKRQEQYNPYEGYYESRYDMRGSSWSSYYGYPGEAQRPAPRADRRGIMDRDKGSFGFILDDDHKEHVFVMPQQCEGFGGKLPPVSARVQFTVALDPKSGKPRAEDVWPYEDGSRWRSHGWHGGEMPYGEEWLGTVESDKGSYGFIRQDCTEEPMFMLPPLLPVGTRVMYKVIMDHKTGRPRAEDVRPSNKEMGSGRRYSEHSGASYSSRDWTRDRGSYGDAAPHALPAPPLPGHEDEIMYGLFDKDKGTFGFILQDSDQQHVFVMPSHCEGFGGALPALGTRVMYRMGQDPKTGKLRAEDVQPEPEHDPEEELQEGEEFQGVMDKDKGNFGFIRQDGTSRDMFVLPTSCRSFGCTLPPQGTRVAYHVVRDHKTGRMRAEDVRLLEEEEDEAAGKEDGEPDPSAEKKRSGRAAKAGVLATLLEKHRGKGMEDELVEIDETQEGSKEDAGEDVGEDAGEDSAEAKEEEEPEEAMPAPEPDSEELAEQEEYEKLLARVREAQEESPEVWNAFCDREGSGLLDPRRHKAEFLRHFLDDIYFYIRCSGPDSGRKTTKRGHEAGDEAVEDSEAPPEKAARTQKSR